MKLKQLKSVLYAFVAFGFLVSAQDVTALAKKDSLTIKGVQNNLRSWSVQAFIGQPLVYPSFLISDFVTDIGNTYDFQLGVTKNINHAIAFQILGNYGKTKQYGLGSGQQVYSGTEYYAISINGDVNLSALTRKVNISKLDYYKWALHAYGGVGKNGYKPTYGGVYYGNLGYSVPSDKVKLSDGSTFFQAGLGLRRRINKSIDVELKQMLMVTNDATFDGTIAGFNTGDGFQGRAANSYNGGNINITSIGVHYKIGKKESEHLSWVDPNQAIVTAAIVKSIASTHEKFSVCKFDNDLDGVCDEWDKELTTPIGARVDGSGTALDIDLDKVIDLLDKCVTIPGEGSPTGCPDKLIANNSVLKDKLSSINLALEGIDFDLNSAVIKPQYFAVLDQAAFIMQEFPGYNFNVEGHTDAQGSNYYNYVLSKKRAESVKTYLVSKQGISPGRLVIEPKGETDLKNKDCQPHANCDDNKNRENRRIIFVPAEK